MLWPRGNRLRFRRPHCIWPSWSRDGQSLFFQAAEPEPGWWRFNLGDTKSGADRHVEQRFPWPAMAGSQPGLNNTLITTRNTGTDEIYALDWETP